MEEYFRTVYEQHLYAHWLARYRAYIRNEEANASFLEEHTVANRMATPQPVHEAYEFYAHHISARDIGAVQVLHVPNDAGDTYAVYTTTDGDDGWIEIYTPDGQLLGAGRFYIELVAWGARDEIRALVGTQELPPRLANRQAETLWGKPLEELPSGPEDQAAADAETAEAEARAAAAEARQIALLDTAARFMLEDDWPVSREDPLSAIRTIYKGDSGQWNCYARARGTTGQLGFFSLCPVYVPDERRLAMAEFLTRANYGLVMGNFEMDMSDGEIRYKTSADLEEVPLDAPWMGKYLQNLFYANVTTMDRYLPGILRVISSDESPEDVIASIEQR